MPKREPAQPILSVPTGQAVIAMGIDPGFANMGIAVIAQAAEGAPIVTVELRHLETTPTKARELRKGDDDAKRLRAIFSEVQRVVADRQPNIVGIEEYRPFVQAQKRGSKVGMGQAWKAAMAYGAACGGVWAHGVSLRSFTPADLKRAFAIKANTSKEQVGATLAGKVEGLSEWAGKAPKKAHSHVQDAVGHAYLALMACYEMRSIYGGIS